MDVNAEPSAAGGRSPEPGAPPTVSVALIVKNEARVLARCLDRLRGAVDELVVVDTGSDDDTVAIARRYTDRVFVFPWTDDFAAARQFAFDRATGDWVAWVDADDVVLHADRIRPLVAGAAPDIAGFSWRYVLGRDAAGEPTFEFWRERCVRNDGRFRWVGAVHEVLVAGDGSAVVPSAAVVVEHQPPPDRPDDPGRNRRILEAEYARDGGAMDPRRLFYLGREHADAGDAERAIATLRQYLAVGTWADERYLAQTQVAALLRALGRYPEAREADLAALAIHPRWPDAYLGLAETAYYLGRWDEVIHWADIGRVLPVPDTVLFVNRPKYAHRWIIHYTNALFRMGRTETALAWTRRALDLALDDPWHRHNLAFFAGLVAAGPPIPIDASVVPLPTYAVIPVRDRHELTGALLVQLGLPPDRAIVVDNGSAVPAREALAGLARVVDVGGRNLSVLWNVGLDLVASECAGPHNVAVLNNDLEVPPGFLADLEAGLRVRPDHVIAYPDWEGRLPPGVCDPGGRMSGFAFVLRGEAGLRADPRFAWWYGDDDLARQGRARGKVVCVGGVGVRHLAPNASTAGSDELRAVAEADRERFAAKWG